MQPDSQSAKSDKSSSRSGSPVSGVASPALSSAATTGGGGGGAGGEKTAAVNAELLAKMAAMKQASSLPGMLSGKDLNFVGYFQIFYWVYVICLWPGGVS